MSLATLDQAMTKRNDVSTKIDADVLENARLAAAMRKQSLAEFLSEVVAERADEIINSFKPPGAKASPKKPKGGGE